ncbi:glycosyltransferase [Pectinatus haikarae]|uniref:Glycosyltransferase involved in cell wall biosynthesis n=1 Tax=Pectinatus haikarae TaxID=349096 RepID=A0ABT9YBD0_9FIRM|nr:glycosyltransferase family 2 protein [Pectinatus haikarae]MDQ0205147.1 glycosyltransferase involved in cell wall biosynthesis [Pectinatus haikarae]
MVKISACVIVKNEEKNIKDYLKRIGAVADEIVVVDTGSTDGTRRVAEQAHVKVYDFLWRDDFSAAKNFALGKATGNWILFLDADEYFTDESTALIRKNIAAIEKNVKIFMCKLTNINERGKSAKSVYVVRGFRNDSKLRYKGKVHEQLFFDDREITDIAVMSDVEIYHTGYQKNIEEKLRRNLMLMNKDIAENGDNPRYYSAIADCYYGLGDYNKAIVFARKFIKSGLRAVGGENQVFYTLISAMRLSGKNSEEILAVLDKYGKSNLYGKMNSEKLSDSEKEKSDIFISACVIVKNEEKNIQRYLKYMLPLANEIIVVDTGSTDNTRDIARNTGVAVYEFTWCNDFAAAKNFALDKAKGKWIIFLDADEYFPKEDGVKLVEYVNGHDADSAVDAVVCRLTNIDADRNDEFIGSFYQLRIFRNSSDMRYVGKIHESLQGKNGKIIKIVVLKDNINIMHTGYSSSVMREKAERNLSLLEKEIADNGETPKHYAYLADCYYSMQDYERVISYSKKFIDSGMNMIGAETNVYMRLIDGLILAKHSNGEIIEAIELAVNKFPDVPDFLFMKSFFLFKKQRYKETEEYLSRAFNLWRTGEKPVTSSTMPRLLSNVYETAGALAQLKGDFPKAVNYFIKSLKENRYNVSSFNGLYKNIGKKNSNLIIKTLDKIYSTNTKDMTFLLKMLGQYTLGLVFLHYCDLFQDKCGTDISEEYILLARKEYIAVSDFLVKELVDKYKKLMLEALINKDVNKYETIYAILPEVYKRIFNQGIESFN